MFIRGVFAALGSPLMMTVGFVIWDKHWKGTAFSLNLFKCSLASLMFIITVCVLGRIEWSLFGTYSAYMLMLSSLLGIVIGDNTWLRALQLLGARRVIIVDSLKPFLAAILGAIILQEELTALSVCGMVLTGIGVLVVSFEEIDDIANDEGKDRGSDSESDSDNQEEEILFNTSDFGSIEMISLEEESLSSNMKSIILGAKSNNATIGYLYSALNVFLDAYGSILTKQYGVTYTTWEINLIRFGSAAVAMGVVATAGRCFHVSTTTCICKEKGSHQSDAVHLTACALCPWLGIAPATVGEKSTGELKFESLDGCGGHDECGGADSNESDGGSTSTDSWYDMPFGKMSTYTWGTISLGVFFVTFLCPAMSNYALFQMNVGLCLTLTSLGPIYSLPIVWYMKNEATSSRGILGTFVAFIGVAMLCYSEGNQKLVPEIVSEVAHNSTMVY